MITPVRHFHDVALEQAPVRLRKSAEPCFAAAEVGRVVALSNGMQVIAQARCMLLGNKLCPAHPEQ